MNQNSLQSHQQNLFEGVYSKASEAILKALENLKEATPNQISEFLKVTPNKISGRFKDLLNDGKIEEIGKVKINNRFNSVYKLKDGIQ